ncbi:hypothetical protein Q3G72_027697 [Acer saccharum]|nr:hypothetical protein Q3G72_027697 [Acer saccharum]
MIHERGGQTGCCCVVVLVHVAAAVDLGCCCRLVAAKSGGVTLLPLFWLLRFPITAEDPAVVGSLADAWWSWSHAAAVVDLGCCEVWWLLRIRLVAAACCVVSSASACYPYCYG